MNDFFPAAFAATLDYEGSYVDDPADPGGETKWGISKRSYPDLCIASLTVEDAKQIYRRDYWNRLGLGKLNSECIAGEIFDTAVNAGRGTAAKIAQRALNYLGENLLEDGVCGSLTIAALNKWISKDERALFVCLNGFQFIHYHTITQRKNCLKRFARGWTKRIQQYKEG